VRWLELTVVGAVALCLRLYRIQDYTAFQGDQGVDALVVKRILVDGVLPLEGPATSAGGVHLGPFYYYLLALPMRLDWLDPLADAALMALLGGLTTGLVYLLARSWFGRIPALVAASASAVSPAAIVASRSAWNPAPTPFFVLLALLGIEASRRTADGRWLVLVGPALACLLQLHYFTLAVAGVLTIAAAWLIVQSRSIRWAGWMGLGLAMGGVLFAPLLLHELTTGFPNLHAAGELVIGGAAGAPRPDSLPRRAYAVLAPMLVGQFLTGGRELPAVVVTLALIWGVLRAALQPGRRFGAVLLSAILATLLVQAVVYRGPVFEHYLIAYAPVAFLGLAATAVHLTARVVLRRVVGVVGLLGLLAFNIADWPFGAPERQLARSEYVAALIAAAAGPERFGLWLLAENDSDGAYRFQLERIGRAPARPDEALPRQLFVLCQDRQCGPSEVRTAVGSDWLASQLEGLGNAAGVDVYRLTADGSAVNLG
jgi:hypothetical protein